eukprot:2473194-Amphidinium_carterae.1
MVWTHCRFCAFKASICMSCASHGISGEVYTANAMCPPGLEATIFALVGVRHGTPKVSVQSTEPPMNLVLSQAILSSPVYIHISGMTETCVSKRVQM